jgi:hypothetical protein
LTWLFNEIQRIDRTNKRLRGRRAEIRAAQAEHRDGYALLPLLAYECALFRTFPARTFDIPLWTQ